MTTITFTDYDIPFNRFDQPLLGVASDALHLLVIWPATSDRFGFIDDVDYKSPTDEFKRAMLEKQDGVCPWCQDRLDFDDIEVDHVWPRSKGGRHWIFNLQVLHSRCNREKSDRIDFAVENILSTLLPLIWSPPLVQKLIRWLSNHPRLAALIVGGIALIVAISIVVKWLRKHVDGVRRYILSLRESLSHTANTLSRHLGDASQQALKVQSNACGFAQRVRGIAGHVPVPLRHAAGGAGALASAHVPAVAGDALKAVSGAGRTSSQAVQDTARRVADVLPRPRRKTRPARSLNRVPNLHPAT